MKQITANTNVSPAGSLMMGGFLLAGVLIICWGLGQLSTDRADASSQCALSLALGGAFVAIAFVVLRSQWQQKTKIDWLNKHGAWITARPIDVRVVTTDSVRRAESYYYILEPTEQARRQYDLDGVTFETEQIWMRGIPEHFRRIKMDVVIDPQSPHDTYFVNVDLTALMKAQIKDDGCVV